VAAHEADVVPVRRFVLFATGLVVMMIVVAAILTLVMKGFFREEQRLRLLIPPRFAGDSGEWLGPALQANPPADLAKLKEEEQTRLNSYGWVDREAGVAHIPIARAIDILARTGLPKTPPRPVEAIAPGLDKPPSASTKKAAPQPTSERKP
jgi:hypothetical protein